jgi:hypothetical protein
MDAEIIKKAKQQYVDHGCDYYFMSLDSDLDEYMSFNIPKETEREWDAEYVKDNIGEMLSDTNIDNLWTHASDILRVADRLDDYTEIYRLLFGYVESNIKNIPSYDLLLIYESMYSSINYSMSYSDLGMDTLLPMLDELISLTESLEFREISKASKRYRNTNSVDMKVRQKKISRYQKSHTSLYLRTALWNSKSVKSVKRDYLKKMKETQRKKSSQFCMIDVVRNDPLLNGHLYRVDIGGFNYDNSQDGSVYRLRNGTLTTLSWKVSMMNCGKVGMRFSIKSERLALLAFYVFVSRTKIGAWEKRDGLVSDELDGKVGFNDNKAFAKIMKKDFPKEYVSIGKIRAGAVSLIKRKDGYYIYYYSSDRSWFSWYLNPGERNRAFGAYYNYCSIYKKYREQVFPKLEKWVACEGEGDLLAVIFFYGIIEKVITNGGKTYLNITEYINDRARELRVERGTKEDIALTSRGYEMRNRIVYYPVK